MPIKPARTYFVALILATASMIAAADQQPDAEVEILKFKFNPQEITIKAGDTIRWTNVEKRQYHSVWFEQAGDPEPGYFFPGETYQRNFPEPGTFPYRCGPHPKMTGVVHVK